MTAQPVEAPRDTPHDAPLASPAATAGGMTRSGAARIDAIDLLRGLVIVLMVLDHVRDFFHAGAFAADPVDAATTNAALFFTRFVTHFCAPAFVFLAGTSVFLQRAQGKGRSNLTGFLLTRGLWLIVLEFTVLNFAWNFGVGAYFPVLQVIWAIGWAMIALAALIWLPTWAVFAIGLAIAVGHNALDPVTPGQFGELAPLWAALHEGGPWPAASVLFAYPVLPWIGVAALGYAAGVVFLMESGARDRRLAVIGLAMIAAFLILRGFNLYGDPRPWTLQAEPLRSVFDFLNVYKYPPSLAYLLVTLGSVLAVLPLIGRMRGPVAAFFLTFGRVPLFAYVAHIFIVHALATGIGLAFGQPMWGIGAAWANPGLMQGWGFGLPVVYLMWAVTLLLLYPLSRWFEGVKRRRRDWWLSYL